MITPISQRDLLIRSLKIFGASFLSALAATWLLIEYLAGYIFGSKPLSGSGAMGLGLVVLECAFFAIGIVLVDLFRQFRLLPLHKNEEGEQCQEERQLELTLTDELKTAYDNERWEEVLKIGSVLSRPLWTTGKYKLRVSLGKLVESAAAYSKRPREQASALIDDLGWTNYALGNVAEAKKHISHGIHLASTVHDHFLEYKGLRHLSGIALVENDLLAAERYMDQSANLLPRFAENHARQEVLAGLYVNKALIFMKIGSFEDALENLDVARDMYRHIGDSDREAKLYHFIGDALYGMGDKSAAKDLYREGLTVSKRASRKDGILMNSIGIARIAVEDGDLAVAKHAYEEAAKTAEELGLREKAAQLAGKSRSL